MVAVSVVGAVVGAGLDHALGAGVARGAVASAVVAITVLCAVGTTSKEATVKSSVLWVTDAGPVLADTSVGAVIGASLQ